MRKIVVRILTVIAVIALLIIGKIQIQNKKYNAWRRRKSDNRKYAKNNGRKSLNTGRKNKKLQNR